MFKESRNALSLLVNMVSISNFRSFTINVAKDWHSLNIRLGRIDPSFSSFCNQVINDIGRNLELLDLIARYEKSKDLIISWKLIDQLNIDYDGDLKKDLSRYLNEIKDGFLLSEDAFLLRRLMNENNEKLLVLLINNFRDIDRNYIRITGGERGIYIGKDYSFFNCWIETEEFIFKTSEFVELLLEVNEFLSMYNRGELLGLTSSKLSTESYNIRVKKLDIDLQIDGN